MRIAPPRTSNPRISLTLLVLIPVIIGITLRAWTARLPGWDPASLWFDDLQYSAVTRVENLWTMLSVVAQAPPGFMVMLSLPLRPSPLS